MEENLKFQNIQAMIKIEETFLKKCTFDNQCDFCNIPEGGTFCRSSGYEYDDDFYWICKKCFDNIAKRFPKFDELRLITKIDKMQEDLPVKLPL